MRGVLVFNGLEIEVLNWRNPVPVLRDGVAFLETFRDLKTLCSVDIFTRLTDKLGSMTKILLFNDNDVGTTERPSSLSYVEKVSITVTLGLMVTFCVMLLWYSKNEVTSVDRLFQLCSVVAFGVTFKELEVENTVIGVPLLYSKDGEISTKGRVLGKK